jgi:hypothetical protein
LRDEVLMLTILLALGVADAGIPLDTPIPDAVSLDITQQGFATVGTIAESFVPPLIDVGDFYDYDCVTEIFGWCAVSYEYDVQGVWVGLAVDQLSLRPAAGNKLELDGGLTIHVNDPADPIYVRVEAEGIGIPISSTCDAWVTDFQVDLAADVTVSLIDDPIRGRTIDFTVGTPAWNWTLTEDNVELDGCSLDDINTVLDFFGYNLIEILIEEIEPTVDDLVQSLPNELEPVLDEFLPELEYVDTIDLAGVPLDVQLVPDDLLIDGNGLRIEIAGRVDSPQHECIAHLGVTEMDDTPSTAPAVGSVASGVNMTPDVIGVIDDDFVNQVLFAAWNGGLLCYELGPDSDLGLPIPTSALLNLVAPDEDTFELFEDSEVTVNVLPARPPSVTPQGSSDVNVLLEDLGLGFYADLDGRTVRALNVDLDVELGTDVNFDGQNGLLGVDIDLFGAVFTADVTHNEYAPGTDADIEAEVPAVIDTFIPLVNGLLSDLEFAIPSYEGLGVSTVLMAPTGSADDRFGIYAAVGPVPYTGGCDDKKGCGDTSSCSSGCSTGTLNGRAVILLVLPLLTALMRRRRQG